MVENIIVFGIMLLVSLVMIFIGVSQIRSKEPVGFYTGEQPPQKEQLSNVKEWNKKHGYTWIIYIVSIIGSIIFNLYVKSETIASAIILCVIIGAITIMILYHRYLKNKYYI